MWLFLLSLLAFESVQSASIGYPYRSLWTYTPFNSGSLHGYLRYLENNEAAGVVGYNSPQPVYAVRQIKYVNGAAPITEETFAINNSEEIIKARETYLQAASLQQYQNLKKNIDALKAEGKEPSAEKLLRLQMLEKVAFASDFSLIADLPEVRGVLQDLEASISGLGARESVQQTSNQQVQFAHSPGEIKTYIGESNIPLVAIEETPEQKQARENHLRIYNEQIAHLKQLEAEHQKYIQEASSKSNILKSQNDKKIAEQADAQNAKALAELEKAQQEHFRLWNEAKLRAEQAGYESSQKAVDETANKQQTFTLTNDQNIYNPKQIISSIEKSEAQTTQALQQQQSLKTIGSVSEQIQTLNEQAKLRAEQEQKISEQKHISDTKEVEQAREQHLRIVDEQKQQQEQNIKAEGLSHQSPKAGPQTLKVSTSALGFGSEQFSVKETDEVKKAREEHLRLVHEANLRAQFVEQQELMHKQESQVPLLKSQYGHQHTEKSQNVEEQSAKSLVFQSQPQQPQIIGETPEVQRAREEHLRIFNSIKSHVEEEQIKQNSRIFEQPMSQQSPIADYSIEEERLLELERLREAERLQKEQQLLEFERLREAERLAEEKRQMDDELIRLRLEEEQRLQTERLMEEKRLQQEQEEMQKLKSLEHQESILPKDSADQQPQIAIASITNVEEARSEQSSKSTDQQSQLYANNPFLQSGQALSEPVKPLEHPASQQSSFFKAIPAQVLPNAYQHNSIGSSHHSSGSKHQYHKDYIKYNYQDAASSQPADTAVALIALEKATNDHFRAHELALEQLRLARIQKPAVKDCN